MSPLGRARPDLRQAEVSHEQPFDADAHFVDNPAGTKPKLTSQPPTFENLRANYRFADTHRDDGA